ncbi:very low-density lipoprotein receptor-like [Liolophura sinensis]|uniref:very low-density lipoprotein receptor-like n=1 Tax=Liolophura sinensis TaxID=3198878 RepID=UPI003158CE21
MSKTSTLHWVVNGNLGTMWKTAAITLPRGDYSIILEGSRGSEYTSDMAIDDITSRLGACPAVNFSCQDDQFSCHTTNLCLPMSKRCDTVNNCGDFSDEMDCECTDKQYYFQCNYGNCIKAYMQCDNNTDCPDGSDEVNCVCPRGQAQCPDGKCIMSEWLCDGDWDCRDGWDEDNCLTCKLDEHTCQDYTCVPQSQVCDGEYNCADRSDEEYCVRRRSWDSMLEVRHGLSWLPVCYSDWDAGLGHEICDITGEGPYNGTVRLNYASSSYLRLREQRNQLDEKLKQEYWV